jgi:hypothetical protein
MAARLPGGALLAHGDVRRSPLVETWRGHDGARHGRPAAPTARLGRGAAVELTEASPGCCRCTGGGEGGGRLGGPVVEHAPEPCGPRARPVTHVLPPWGAVTGGAPPGPRDRPPAAPRRQAPGQGAGPLPAICVLVTRRPAWRRRPRGMDVAAPWGGACRATDRGRLWGIGVGRPVPAVRHPPHQLGPRRGKAAGPSQPGRARGVWRRRRTVSSERASPSPHAPTRSAHPGIVPPVRPRGGARQARASSQATGVPSHCRRAPGRGWSCHAASRPPAPPR